MKWEMMVSVLLYNVEMASILTMDAKSAKNHVQPVSKLANVRHVAMDLHWEKRSAFNVTLMSLLKVTNV